MKLIPFFLLFMMLILAGCGNPALVRPLQKTEFAPKPKYYPIQVMDGVPDRSFDVVAEVRTRAYDINTLEVAGKSELRSLARKCGGDAVIQVMRHDDVRESFGYRPGALLRLGTRFENRSFLSGLVIRFTGNP